MVGDREGIFNSITVEMLRKKIIKYRRNSKLTKVAKLLVLNSYNTYYLPCFGAEEWNPNILRFPFFLNELLNTFR
jgi:hypothetical protein